MDPGEWARKTVALGAGEISITSVDREGYDLELTRRVSEAVSVPVIANGGVGSLRHFVEELTAGKTSAVAAASILHFTDQSVIKAKTIMKQAGLDVLW